MQAATAETENKQINHPVVDPSTGQAREALMPSEVAKPTRTNSEPQQASTQPGDGSKSHHEAAGNPAAEVTQQQEGKVPWKDQVLGYAKVTRGKVLGKEDTQEVGHKILQGEIVPEETKKTS